MRYVCSGLEMAELDRQTIEEFGVPGRVLLELAGRGVADAVQERVAAPGPVVVLCGPGNNGGDGFVCARALGASGFQVEVALFANHGRLRGDARDAFQTLERENSTRISFIEDARELWELSTRMDAAALVVDALLGTGLDSPVRGLIAEAIDLTNRSPAPCIAVDLPSGVQADTGQVLGRCTQATETVTFAYAKRAHYLYPAKECRGRLRIVDIGIPRALPARFGVIGRVLDENDGPALMLQRSGESHKGTFGHCVVVGGSARTPGAAVLASLAAIRSGAGLTSLATEPETLERAVGLIPEIMLRVASSPELSPIALEGADAVVVGPGLGNGEGRLPLLSELFAADVPLCVDADGLNIIAEHPKLWDALSGPTVITPHPKEMARLLATSVEEVQRDRFASALQIAMGRGCVVVLKGAGTVIADPEGGVAVLDVGNPGMATGGTGDVLAGMIGGLLAQGFDPVRAAHLGALWHGAAGDLAAAHKGAESMIASDLLERLGDVRVRWAQ